MTDATINLLAGWQDMMHDHIAACHRTHPVPTISADEFERFRALVARISYRDSRVAVINSQGRAHIQFQSVVADSATGRLMNNGSRPLALCPEMSDAFIVDLAFELVKEFELHEAAELFRLDGASIYYPHAPTGTPVFAVPAMRASLQNMPPIRTAT